MSKPLTRLAPMDRDTARSLGEVNRTFARTKVIAAEIKRSPTDGSGRFVALVSTFGPPPDVQGDIIARHAFDQTIIEARALHPQSLWPVWWQHGYSDPANVIGVITAAVTTDEGLIVEGRLNIDSSEKALSIYQAMLEDSIREWSISFAVIAEHKETLNGETVNVLDELTVLEISSVMAGANRFTRTLQVKSDTAAAQALREFLKSYIRVGGSTDPESIETASAVFTALWTPTSDHEVYEDSEVKRYNAILDSIEGKAASPRGDGPDLVDEWIASDRAARLAAAAEAAAEEERIRAWNDQVRDMPRPMSEPDLDARIADQNARDLQEINRRAAERKFELERDLAEQAALREGGFNGVHYYREEQ